MKRNTNQHIEEALAGIERIAEGLPKGKADRIAIRCYRIRQELEKAQNASTYPETVDPPFEGPDVRNAMDKRLKDKDRVLAVLESGDTITSAQAIKMGILRLGARIWDLRNAGHKIETRLVKTAGGDRIAEYRLIA